MGREWLPLITTIFFIIAAAQVSAADTTQPTIESITPDNNTETYATSLVFGYTPNDDTGVYRCNLYINELRVRTSSEIKNGLHNEFAHTLLPGAYNWSIDCQDSANNQRQTANRTIKIIEDKVSPNITLQYFSDPIKSETVVFNYTIFDNGSGIDKCELIIGEETVMTSTSVTENQTQQFSYTSTEGEKTWMIKCTDKQGNSKTSDTAGVSVKIPPKVTLNSPSDNAITDAKTLVFKYTASSTRNITHCDLMLNGQKNQVQYSIAKDTENSFEVQQIATQDNTWTIFCTDRDEITGKAAERKFTVTAEGALESAPPKVALAHPIDTTVANGTKFSYKVSSALGISICELYIDDLWNMTSANVEKDIQQEFDFRPLALGTHSWYVKCIDSRQQASYSDNATFIVSATLPPPVEQLPLAAKKEGMGWNITLKTREETLGKTRAEQIFKIVIFLVAPLAIIAFVLGKEIQTRPYGLYSRRG